MDLAAYRADVLREFEKVKALADRAMAQTSEASLHHTLGTDENSIAILVKHLSGNLRSRWKDVFTSDGEKPDRDRDREFITEAGDTRESLLRRWEESWSILFDVLRNLRDEDLDRVVLIRGEGLTLFQALNRQLAHYAYHAGQIVFLARHFAGDAWTTLSIAKGKVSRIQRVSGAVREALKHTP